MSLVQLTCSSIIKENSSDESKTCPSNLPRKKIFKIEKFFLIDSVSAFDKKNMNAHNASRTIQKQPRPLKKSFFLF